jgi:two-component system, cell cycle sensor histidine kinase and response regulator CckA
VVVLLIGRQALALRDVMRLTIGLEAQVADRTRALHEATAALMQTQRMNVVATVGAGLAHDFNNLLTVVTSAAEVARLDANAGRSPVAEDLGAIRDAGQRAAELSTRLMMLARGQHGTAARLDLGTQVRELERLLRALAPPPIRLDVAIGPGPLAVWADPLEIQQILVNLVANARDAMPAGGELHVASGTEAGRSGSWLRVSDTGVGMAPEVASRVFEPFFSTKGPGKGTGLGLASVKSIVDALGGRIELETALGRGTTFLIHLPGDGRASLS